MLTTQKFGARDVSVTHTQKKRKTLATLEKQIPQRAKNIFAEAVPTDPIPDEPFRSFEASNDIPELHTIR